MLCKTFHQVQLKLFFIVAKDLIKQSECKLCKDDESKRSNAFERHADIAFKKWDCNIKKNCILIMMLEEYIYDVSDDNHLNQRCRSLENEKKLKFIMKIECHIRRIAVQVNDFFCLIIWTIVSAIK